jgi:hypothetical protein
VYESEKTSNGGDYKAYLNPKVIRPVSESEQFALRVVIEQREYDEVIKQYDGRVQKGELKQSIQPSSGKSGARFTGKFSKDISGDAVVYDCRDKTITVRTDALDTFKNEFESIYRTIDYNS